MKNDSSTMEDDFKFSVIWGYLPVSVWHSAYHQIRHEIGLESFETIYGDDIDDLAQYVIKFRTQAHADRWKIVVHDLLIVEGRGQLNWTVNVEKWVKCYFELEEELMQIKELPG